MRLFVSLGESSVNELKFDRGPIYVGRQMGSQVFLPDKAVSRQHAVFYTTKDSSWIIEDLGPPIKPTSTARRFTKQNSSITMWSVSATS